MICTKSLLIVLVALGAASAALDGVGKCKKVSGLSNFDFKKFSTENGGIWHYKYVPDVPKYANVKSVYLKSEPVEGGKFRTRTFSTDIGSNTATVTSDQIRESKGHGHVQGIGGNGKNIFEIDYLAYVEGDYVIYYLCSNTGAESTDTVTVLSNKKGPLSDKVKTLAKNLAKSNRLEVTFKELL